MLCERDARVVATELEGEALQRDRAASGDETASNGPAGERDLLDAMVLGVSGAYVIVYNHDIDGTGREDCLRSFDDANVTERGD